MSKKFTFLFRVFCALMILISLPKYGCGQSKNPVTIYSESFGDNGSSNTAYSSYSNYSATTDMFVGEGTVASHYTATGKIGKNNVDASTGYTGASGNSAAWFTAGSGSNTNDALIISDINIDGYESLSLSFGIIKKNGTNTTNKTTVSYKIDNGSYQTLSFTHPTDADWHLASGSISVTGSRLTIKFTMATSGGFTTRYDDIKVTGTASGPVTYTVTYNGNGSTSGTVPTDSNSPYANNAEVTVLDNTGNLAQTGYTLSNWNTAANGSGNSYDAGDKLNITANTTLYAQWTLLIITPQSNDDSYGTVALSGTTITATPTSGYRVKAGNEGYTVTSGTATVTNNGDNTFSVVPTTDCTVQINFEAIPTHTATFSVNGTTSTQDFAEGAAITFPSNPADISGKTFVGWATDAIDGITDEAPDFVTSATMGTSNVTYYAVFADESGIQEETLTISNSDFTNVLSGSYGTGSIVKTIGGTDYTIYLFACKQNSMCQLRASDSYIQIPTLPGTITNISTTACNNAGTESYSGTIRLKSAFAAGTTDTYDIFIKELSSVSSFNIDLTDNISSFYFVTSAGLRINDLSVTYGVTNYNNYSTDVYTITAASNNTEYGTVSLSGLVITGSPKTGYRYASPAYSVSPDNSATVVQYGNEFTVTLSASTTVTINFAAIPTHTLSSAISPADAGTVTFGSATVAEGFTTTATANAAAGFKFKNWSISETGATLSSTTDNPTTVTMGTANATVTATFEAVPTNAITYSVNGVTNTVNVEANTAIDLSAPASALIPIGYVFKGWRTSVIATPTDTAPTDYVTSATSTEDITYYAVMAVDSESNVTTHLASDEIATNFAATAMAYADEEKSYNDTDENMTWSARCITNSSRHWIQLKSDNDVYIKAVAPQNITEVKVTISNASNSSGGIDDITKHGAFSGSVNLDKVQNNNAGSCGTAASSAIVNNILTINANGSSNTIYIHVTGAARIWNVDVKYTSITSRNFCTSVSSVELADDVTIDGDLDITYTLTVPSGKILKVNGKLTNETAANLIIEDGGQLISSYSVAATVKKTITPSDAPTEKGAAWYTISSPVNNKTSGGENYETVAGVTNLVPSTGKYDLYRFNETKNDVGDNLRWENYKVHNYDLEMGRGYIYRNNTGDELAFTGNINVGPITYTLTKSSVPDLVGFNLIGNPYPHSIAKGSDEAIYHSNLATNYYILSDDDTWQPCTDGSEIPSKQGILVQLVNGTEVDLTITDTPFTPAEPGKYRNDNIRFSVANEQFEDVAYAWFDKGYGLNKIAHRNPKAPMLYIPQDGKNYATAIMNDDIKVFGLSFKAMTTGKYTISAKALGNFSYIHLIDRLTGEDVDLLMEDYSFIGSPADSDARFIVKLTYMPSYSTEGNDNFAYQTGSEILVSGEGELQIFDVTGRKVMTTTINGVEAISGLPQGVYIFRVIGENQKTQKIVVK